MPKFRSKPNEIEAFRWTVDVTPEWWLVLLSSGEQSANPSPGDYVARDGVGRVFFIKQEELDANFESADEPYFRVMGRDQLAQGTVLGWIERARRAQVSQEKIDKAWSRYNEIINFQSEHPDRVKVPD